MNILNLLVLMLIADWYSVFTFFLAVTYIFTKYLLLNNKYFWCKKDQYGRQYMRRRAISVDTFHLFWSIPKRLYLKSWNVTDWAVTLSERFIQIYNILQTNYPKTCRYSIISNPRTKSTLTLYLPTEENGNKQNSWIKTKTIPKIHLLIFQVKGHFSNCGVIRPFD